MSSKCLTEDSGKPHSVRTTRFLYDDDEVALLIKMEMPGKLAGRSIGNERSYSIGIYVGSE